MGILGGWGRGGGGFGKTLEFVWADTCSGWSCGLGFYAMACSLLLPSFRRQLNCTIGVGRHQRQWLTPKLTVTAMVARAYCAMVTTASHSLQMGGAVELRLF